MVIIARALRHLHDRLDPPIQRAPGGIVLSVGERVRRHRALLAEAFRGEPIPLDAARHQLLGDALGAAPREIEVVRLRADGIGMPLERDPPGGRLRMVQHERHPLDLPPRLRGERVAIEGEEHVAGGDDDPTGGLPDLGGNVLAGPGRGRRRILGDAHALSHELVGQLAVAEGRRRGREPAAGLASPPGERAAARHNRLR